MNISILKAKLHHARVSQVELEYEGSCAIDEALLDISNIKTYEKIHIYNKTNGERFSTYVIRAERNSGTISINGAAAKKASVNDRIIICAYANMTEEEAEYFEPKLVYLDQDNKVVRTGKAIPTQV